MADIWFISDTHFCHENMYKFTKDDGSRVRAEFENSRQGDEYIVEQWNNYVKVQDKIYHLGDVTFQYNGLFNNIMARLNGHKRLIVGNHDKLNTTLMRWFEKVELWTGGKFKKHGFVASHIPLREDQMRKVEYNVHGHTHYNLLNNPRYVNVCVECTGYRPIHIDELPDLLKKQNS